MLTPDIPENWHEVFLNFVLRSLRYSPDMNVLSHGHTSAYQFACEALVKMGVAEDFGWGVKPIGKRLTPKELIRWDDACLITLHLADQNGLLDVVGLFEKREPEGGEILIRTDDGECPAIVDVSIVRTLASIGLIDWQTRCWTDASKFVRFRFSPYEWRMDIALERQFHRMSEQVLKLTPEVFFKFRDVKEKLEAMGDEDDRSKRSVQEYECSHIFYDCWRHDDGWFLNPEKGVPVGIWSDYLASHMCKVSIPSIFALVK